MRTRAAASVACLTLGVAALPHLADATTAGDPASADSVDVTNRAEQPRPGFRVLPYLQAPSGTSMTVSWISEVDEPGTVRVAGARDGRPLLAATSTPRYQPLLEYTDKELAESIEGLEQGVWLESNSNYKHSVTIDGLKPGRRYTYTVSQGGEQHAGFFETAPEAGTWSHVRLVAFSDSETEPRGRVENREWELSPVSGYADGSLPRPGAGSQWERRFGSTTRYGDFTLRYPMDQDRAMRENMAVIERSDPDLMMVAGDLTQGGGYQPAWDEFFRYVAGEHGDLASRVPFLTALGNWETYAALNGGYGTVGDRSPAVISRNKYLTYFDNPGDPANPQHKGSYYRTDHGPVTVLTLDSTNGIPDEDTRTGTLSNPVFSGDDASLDRNNLSTDTQGEFTAEQYAEAFTEVFPGTAEADSDLPAFNTGSAQWKWTERQLADARRRGKVVIVQFHHAPYSNGVHGTPPNHEYADNQSGVAMRAYSPLFERFGVATVIAGHDEMFERSFVDENGDGVGFQSYDVGVAADGLRGEQLVKQEDGSYGPLRFNTRSEWMAATDAPERWAEDSRGVRQLQDGGLHYGHLQMDLRRTTCGAELTLSPVYVFPVLDSDYDLVRSERRVYDDVVNLGIDRRGRVTPADPGCPRAPIRTPPNSRR